MVLNSKIWPVFQGSAWKKQLVPFSELCCQLKLPRTKRQRNGFFLICLPVSSPKGKDNKVVLETAANKEKICSEYKATEATTKHFCYDAMSQQFHSCVQTQQKHVHVCTGRHVLKCSQLRNF